MASSIPLLFHLALISLFGYVALDALEDRGWVRLALSLGAIALAVNNIVWPRQRVRRARADELRGLP